MHSQTSASTHSVRQLPAFQPRPATKMAGSKRDMAAAMKAVFTTLTGGAALEKRVASRHAVVATMQRFASAIHLPIDSMSYVHISGTKGKGSTAAMCESMLRCSGYSTGMFTSPHLVDMRERFRLNGKPIEEDRFLVHFWHVWDAVQSTVADNEDMHQPGFFHFLTLLGWHIFSQEAVDVVVLEVGLGGRLDATNAISSPAVTGITTLDYDHVKVLGPTLAAIAGEKAGIMKPGAPVFTVPQAEDAPGVLEARAGEVGAPLAVVDAGWLQARLDATAAAGGVEVPASIAGGAGYQRTNAALALALTESYLARGPPPGWATAEDAKLPPLVAATSAPLAPAATPVPSALAEGLGKAHWPGRAHRVTAIPTGGAVEETSGKRLPPHLDLFLDGAHTGAAMERALEWFAGGAAPGPTPRTLFFNSGHDKDPIPLLTPLTAAPWSGVVLAPFDFGKPSRMGPPSASDVFRLHCEHLVERGAASTAQGADMLAEALALLEALPPPTLTPAAQGHAPSTASAAEAALAAAQGAPVTADVSWQRTLASVWGVLAAGVWGGSSLNAATPVTVGGSVGEALGVLGGGAVPGATGLAQAPAGTVPATAPAASVFVTGSLYLVGNTLQAVGWSADD